jgi:hypothetical protein
VAAAVIAIAFVPMLFAYLQLGYHPDIDRSYEPTGEEAVAFLDRSVHGAATETAGEYGWSERAELIDTVRSEVEADIETLETARIEEGIGYRVRYNESGMDDLMIGCVSEPGRRFGECVSEDGIAVQERAGEAVLVAVAFDVRVIAPERTVELTVVIEVE